MGKKFKPERLASIRRMRRARRLYKQQPVFAFEILSTEYADYTPEQFIDDLRYRSKPKPKKKKDALLRYGRYTKMMQCLELFRSTGITEYAIQAQRLRRNMTKPYRVLIKINGKHIEYGLDPLINIEDVERLVAKLRECKTETQADDMINQFRENSRMR